MPQAAAQNTYTQPQQVVSQNTYSQTQPQPGTYAQPQQPPPQSQPQMPPQDAYQQYQEPPHAPPQNPYAQPQQQPPQNPYAQQPYYPQAEPDAYQQYQQPPQRRRRPPKKKSPVALICIIAVLLIAIGVGIYFFFFHNTNGENENTPEITQESDVPEPDADLDFTTEPDTTASAPTPTPEPDETHAEPWIGAYRDFVLNEEFLQTGDAYFTGSEYGEIVFSLYDINDDGIPELLIYTGTAWWEIEYGVHVYTFTNGSIINTGLIPMGESGISLQRAPDTGYPGLFSRHSGEGLIGVHYVSLTDGNVIEMEFVEAIDETGGGWGGSRIGPDEALHDASVIANSNNNQIPFYTLNEIQQMGWEEFIKILR